MRLIFWMTFIHKRTFLYLPCHPLRFGPSWHIRLGIGNVICFFEESPPLSGHICEEIFVLVQLFILWNPVV